MTTNQNNSNPATTSESFDFSKELFRSMPASAAEAEKITRPIVSYWKDALIRIRKNKIAMASVCVITFIACAGIFGPFFFPSTGNDIAYENMQNPDMRDQEPTLGHQMLVVADASDLPQDLIKEAFPTNVPLLAPESLKPPTNFQIVGKATLNGVTLKWDPIEGVSGYQVFRAEISSLNFNENELVTDSSARGVLIATIENPAQYSYTDSAGLNPSDNYAYSVVSYVSNPETLEQSASAEAAAVKTDVKRTMRLSDAQLLKPDVTEGEVIKGRAYLFGTDSLGRDVFARTLQGTRVDFFLALIIPSIAILIGLSYGSISGLAGGKVDLMMMRVIEVLDALPDLLFMVLLQVVLGKGVTSLVIAISATAWLRSARLVRGEVLKLREIEFVQASRLLGAPTSRIIFRHLAPNLIGILLVLWSAMIPGVIQGEAFLSLLGLGLEQPSASWGTVLQDAARRFQSHPLQFFMPLSVLGVSLLAFFLLGDAMRDAFDPKLRGRD